MERCLTLGFIHAAQDFHQIKGHKELPQLIEALELKAHKNLSEEAALPCRLSSGLAAVRQGTSCTKPTD